MNLNIWKHTNINFIGQWTDGNNYEAYGKKNAKKGKKKEYMPNLTKLKFIQLYYEPKFGS